MIRQRKPLPRSTKPIKRSRIKRRPPSKAASLRVYGTQAFRDHLHASPCLWCAIRGDEIIDQAHFGKHATGKKNDWTKTGPLCGAAIGPNCHDRYDRRDSASAWFTPEERALIELRQAQFIAEWQERAA